MASFGMRVLASDEVARATAEMIFALQKAFPRARLVPCEAIEGEAMHLEVHVPDKSPADLAAAQEKVLDLKHPIEDRYDLYILIRVVPARP
jgi:hypothetical protein